MGHTPPEAPHAAHEPPAAPADHGAHAPPPTAGDHGAHGQPGGAVDHSRHVDHTGHEAMFRRRFWVCLALSIPVLLYSPMLQQWLGFAIPAFPGSNWLGPLFSVIIFAYGGVPFLRLAVPELANRRPGMMTLISLAITVAFVYSLATLFTGSGGGFLWELVTLIDVMLLGHWIEMRSVRLASGALNELAKLMPDTAERLRDDGSAEVVPVAQLSAGDRVLVRPGAGITADGEVIEGESDVNEAMITGESRPVGKHPGDRVIAGTINGDGSVRLRVTATGDETALAGIMRLVRQAEESTTFRRHPSPASRRSRAGACALRSVARRFTLADRACWRQSSRACPKHWRVSVTTPAVRVRRSSTSSAAAKSPPPSPSPTW